MEKHLIVGISGASGACYARKFLQQLVQQEWRVHLVISPHGRQLLADELHITHPTVENLLGRPSELVTIYSYTDVGARIASGSFVTQGMVICPCSSSSLGAIANGLGENLLHRAAQVTLKEARRLILLYREMPMSQIDLRNALHLSQAGAIICPASPGFYLLPNQVDDLVDFVAGKLLDLLSIPHTLNTRWSPSTRE
ncbi:MAG: Flavin prenyltransferase UbiX [Phycisphaerae bacterium]|nr:Flavin prenyltransferase UbiX [Phycisphaerae bacterium]